MTKLWDSITNDMHKDYSYLFNKDKICSFQFELKHDVNWWIKYRKIGLIGVWTGTSLFLFLGILMFFLQIYGNQIGNYLTFSLCGSFMWVFAFIWFIDSYIIQAYTIRRYTNTYIALLHQGINNQYLCSDLSKYPYFMQIAKDGVTFNTWKIAASWADKEPKCNMPIWGLVALFTSIKQYQNKYCPIKQINEDDDSNASNN